MTTNTNAKVALVIYGAILLVVIAFIIIAIVQAQPSSPAAQDDPGTGLTSAIRDDSHILDDAGEGAAIQAELDR